MASNGRNRFPRAVAFGRKSFDVRWMRPDDGDALLRFARTLDEDDLLFMRMDLTRQEAIHEWTRQLEEGSRVVLIAEKDGAMVGYGSLNRRPAHWQRHLGEIRTVVAKEHRGSGLGRFLAEQMFATARQMGLTKIVAQMAREQDGARRMFERLGFTAEALLADWIQDRQGKPHDLVLMSHDVTSLTESG
ncbi:MAG TPA: GNAT family N-acetyltransferase [Thermoanaerobaculia bacterium]|nr:GNAT family N-acetyltransferase [Thermoanaerobaculia bacterium]